MECDPTERLVPLGIHDVADLQLRKFLLWLISKGVATGMIAAFLPLIVTELAGRNPVTGSVLSLWLSFVGIAGVLGCNALITPLGDIPSIGRKPLLILTTATAAFSLVILAIWNESKLALYVATFILSLFSTPYMGIVVTVDCIARGACANAFWVWFSCGSVEPRALRPIPALGSPAFVNELADISIAQLCTYGSGVLVGLFLGYAFLLQSTLVGSLYLSAGAYALSSALGWWMLDETLETASSESRGALGDDDEAGYKDLDQDEPAPMSVAARVSGGIERLLAKLDLGDTIAFILRGSDEKGEASDLRAYVVALLCVVFASNCLFSNLAYFVLWRYDLSDERYNELFLTGTVSGSVGLVAYYAYFRDAYGPNQCMLVNAVCTCVATILMLFAYSVTLIFVALALYMSTTAALLQFLYINSTVPVEKQAKLTAALGIAIGLFSLLGVVTSEFVWLGFKNNAPHGSLATREDYPAASGFALSALGALGYGFAVLPLARRDYAARATQDQGRNIQDPASTKPGQDADDRKELLTSWRHRD